MYVSLIRKYCDWQLLLFESAWSVSEILHCNTSRIWGNNQFRIEEKRARNEHEDFQTFRKVFESSALHEVSFFVTEQMHPFTPKHVYASGHVLPRGAQHWTHSCPAIALAWSNVHNSNLAPRRMSRHFQLYRSIDMVPQSELRCVFELWVACQNKNVKLEALNVLNTLKVGWILPLEVACLLGMLSFSLWTAFFVATVLHTCYEMTLGGDTFGASRTRLSWIPVSWWCSECSILS